MSMVSSTARPAITGRRVTRRNSFMKRSVVISFKENKAHVKYKLEICI